LLCMTISLEITQKTSGSWTPWLTDGEHEVLFRIAEDTLCWCLAGAAASFEFGTYRLTPGLEKEFATFVTLRRHGELRGCIGCVEPGEALARSVHRHTHRAATEDVRFAPVSERERLQIDIGISILSALHPIESEEEFDVGRHGILLRKDGCSAVYLPQVAQEQGWGREETLESLCHKGGLPAGAWRSNARMMVFESVSLHREKTP